MSKLVRALMLGAMLVAMSLAAATAVAQEQTTTDAAELFRAGERAAQQQTTTDAAELFRAGERAAQQQTTTNDVRATPGEASQRARSAEPGGRPGLLLALGVLIAALVAVTTTHATRRVRARQAV
jgi:hypothetical protein